MEIQRVTQDLVIFIRHDLRLSVIGTSCISILEANGLGSITYVDRPGITRRGAGSRSRFSADNGDWW
jgi:hypothetical protein